MRTHRIRKQRGGQLYTFKNRRPHETCVVASGDLRFSSGSWLGVQPDAKSDEVNKITEYRYVLRQELCSCFEQHRIYRTYCRYHCDHLPEDGHHGLLLQFQDQVHSNCASQSRTRRASAILSSISLACGIPLAISAA